MAHDFNNILSGIQGNISIMQMSCDDNDPNYQRLSRMEELVQRGANLTRQLLGFAMGGKYDVKILSINDLIRKSIQFFAETRKDITVNLQLRDDLFPVEVDAGQIEQVLVNLYINAGHAMAKGGSITINSANILFQDIETRGEDIKPGDYVRISVSDTGEGIDSETLKKIFEPFFTTRSQQGGTGLGLASAYGIIRNHGGMINARSEMGHGSTFNIYLPAVKGECVVSQIEQLPSKELFSGSGYALLVDDEPMVLDLASEMLQALGYKVFKAANGQEAISIYQEHQTKIHFVVLDMILPGMNGSQVLVKLKEVNPELKVILSSGYSLQGEVQRVMNLGCQGFIQKPYRLKDFSNIIQKVMSLP